MKTTLRLVVLLVLVAVGGWGWRTHAALRETPVPATAAASRGDVAETVLATGVIEAQKLVSVGARVSGQIETLAVHLGQEVAEGDLIATIDSQDQKNAVLQAEADLAQIEAQIAAKAASLEKARLAFDRQSELLERNAVAKEAAEAATAEVKMQAAELDALRAQKARAGVTVASARLALDRTRITAPIAGTIVAVVVREGQTVNAIQSTPTLVKIANLDRMVVKAEISEADVVHVAPGQKVSFTILGEPDQPIAAVVRGIEPAPSAIETADTIATDEAIYYNALLEVENPGHRLRIGMTTQVSIMLDEARDVLTVPASALKREGGGFAVDLWDASAAETRRVPVEVGLNDRVTAEIRSGLSEGDRVVTGSALAGTAAKPATRMRPPMGF